MIIINWEYKEAIELRIIKIRVSLEVGKSGIKKGKIFERN